MMVVVAGVFMGEVMRSILSSSACQRFLAEHPDGWSSEDWGIFFGILKEMFGELDEEELKKKVLEEHLAQRKLREDANEQRRARETVLAVEPKKKGLPIFIILGLILLLLVIFAYVLLEVLRSKS